MPFWNACIPLLLLQAYFRLLLSPLFTKLKVQYLFDEHFKELDMCEMNRLIFVARVNISRACQPFCHPISRLPLGPFGSRGFQRIFGLFGSNNIWSQFLGFVWIAFLRCNPIGARVYTSWNFSCVYYNHDMCSIFVQFFVFVFSLVQTNQLYCLFMCFIHAIYHVTWHSLTVFFQFLRTKEAIKDFVPFSYRTYFKVMNI